MGENVENLVLEYLRRLDKKVDAVAADLREVRTALSGVVQILASQDAHMLRGEVRLGAIEKRLEIYDPAVPMSDLRRPRPPREIRPFRPYPLEPARLLRLHA